MLVPQSLNFQRILVFSFGQLRSLSLHPIIYIEAGRGIFFAWLIFFKMLTNNSSPNHGIQHNSPGLLQVFWDEDFPHGAVEPGDFDAVRASVGPVEVAGHPVHGDAVGVRDLSRDHHLAARAVQEGAADGPHFVIRPVDVSLQRVEVDGDGVADVLQRQHDVREIGRVQGDAPQVRPAGQEQQRGGTCSNGTNADTLQTAWKQRTWGCPLPTTWPRYLAFTGPDQAAGYQERIPHQGFKCEATRSVSAHSSAEQVRCVYRSFPFPEWIM